MNWRSILVIVCLGGVVVGLVWSQRSNRDGGTAAAKRSRTENGASNILLPQAVGIGLGMAASDISPVKLNPAFEVNGSLRPLAASLVTEHFEWCQVDARDTNVIARIAHNELEYLRMVEENSRIYRRQLVYRKEPLDLLVYRHKASGLPIQQLVLPGLDGHELWMEVMEVELHPSGLEGGFTGRLVGDPESMVTVNFLAGREAFTIISPSQNLYLVGEPREPGEIIVKSIDPEKYVPGVCGNP